jgi:hypothetical protein
MIETLVEPQPLDNDVAVIKILQLMGQLTPSDIEYVLKAIKQVHEVIEDTKEMNNIPHIVDSGASVMEEKIEFGLKITSENPDGSANAIVRMNRPAMECILQWGIIKMIEEGIKTYAPQGEQKDGTD